MARPKKQKDLKHHHQIMLRLTDTEYEIISTNAKAASLPLAEYAQKLIMRKQIKVTYEIVADLLELKKLIAAFRKIGSNLNQIARYFNSGHILLRYPLRKNSALLQLELQTFEYFQYVSLNLRFLFSELPDFLFQAHFLELLHYISMPLLCPMDIPLQ